MSSVVTSTRDDSIEELERYRIELDGVLLPDARLGLRGRGRRPGDAHAGVARVRRLRGPRRRAHVALQDRVERLLRPPEGQPAARAADGHGRPRHRRGPARAAARRADLDHARARRPRAVGARSGGARRGARVDPAGVRRGAAAPAAEAARGADPARGAALGGERGGGAARHVGGVREQRAAARAGDAGGEGPLPRRCLGRGARHRRPQAPAPLRRGVRAVRHRPR